MTHNTFLSLLRPLLGKSTDVQFLFISFSPKALALISRLPRTEEHHIQNFDPASFFTLHDFDGSGSWTPDEIRRTYGLEDESSKDVPSSKKESIVTEVLQVWDADGDGRISRDEWMKGWVGQGKRLKDFGTGPGHHGDDEYEYEIHHFEKFHDESMSLSIFPLLLPFSANNKLGQLLTKMQTPKKKISTTRKI